MQEVPGTSGLAILFCIIVPGMMLGFSPQMVAASDQQDRSRHLYERVMREFKHGDYNAALAGFKFYLELHGKSALAANAQYWIGESLYAQRQYEAAIVAFDEVIQKYPSDTHVPTALLKQGYAFAELKDLRNARFFLQQVLKKYPQRSEAQQAEEKLKQLKQHQG